MNLYFLVEGRRTEKKVYPKWLAHLIPELKEINDPFRVTKNNFYLFNGNGFPSLLDNHLKNSIADINAIKKFDYLIICLDSDDESLEDRRNAVLEFVLDNKLELINCKLIVIVQNKCIETWFLGNRNVYSSQPQNAELRKYNKFYNVKLDDPELMTKMDNFNSSAQFHEAYLSEMLLEKNVRYSKKNPGCVLEKYYLDALINRYNETKHLISFKDFLDFCLIVRKIITKK